MWITFCGAAGTVTGSSYLVETERYRFLIDCGMFQGTKELRQLNEKDFLFNPAALDFVVLTHAHVDHCGLLPKLWLRGFKGPIYATKATAEICKIVMADSGHIQEMEAEWRNRKRSRTGEPLTEPLYTANDALSTGALLRPQSYRQRFEPVPGIRINFLDAGHILGSAIAEIWVEENGRTTKVAFSGDLGQNNQPIIQDPEFVRDADYVLMESTYGNRLHEPGPERIEKLRQIVLETVHSQGNLIIPAFAIGRTQDLLYHLKMLFYRGEIPKVPVYIDSPMAVSITEIYRNNPDCYDAETRGLFAAKESPFEFGNLHFVRTTEESKKLNETARGAIIISASGMCEAGRILHHLKHNLWRPQSHILFVGYQAEGTLGRRLLEGAKVVKIMGEQLTVQAQIHSIGGFSAHADQNGLLEWLQGFQRQPRGLFLVHGENQAQADLERAIRDRFPVATFIPRWGDRFELKAGAELKEQRTVAALNNFAFDRKLTDLEHLILALRTEGPSADRKKIHAQVEQLKQELSELEELLRQPA
ncbi:metallo-beta-lactamase family protein [Hydrogenispora ethanolica]|uniref:Metallo-beta-lactamase family protein n=1 Tax=Hydrogenispora ethanolica TaxID=1082276 RepID=A0A4R1RB57_HYDET|nr:MBL fold metallo-hydrolase [Hydrogenispora ethanolica]TCL63013.1 metallo-beta-lactamase family protein [Hydrogenispora ethanolica]